MSLEQEYKKRMAEREGARATVKEIMEVIWKRVEKLDENIERRILTSLITELQIALKTTNT